MPDEHVETIWTLQKRPLLGTASMGHASMPLPRLQATTLVCSFSTSGTSWASMQRCFSVLIDERVELQTHCSPLRFRMKPCSDAQRFRTFLETAVQAVFDYLVERPRLLRILTWEMAEGWQTYAHLASQFPPDESDQFEALFKGAWRAGLLRSDFSA